MKGGVLSIVLSCAVALTARAIDLNGNGMSDVFEAIHSLAPDSADENPDYDGPFAAANSLGWTNRAESLIGSDPHDYHSGLYLTMEVDAQAGEVRLKVPAFAGKRYQVQSGLFNETTKSIDWTPLGPEILGDGSEAVVTTLPPQPGVPAFYRVVAMGDVDEDGDGLSMWEEIQLGTSDQARDTDGDSMSDAGEYALGTDPADYFDGEAPMIVTVSGDGQAGEAGSVLEKGLAVEVRDRSGAVLANAPVRFAVTHGNGRLLENAAGGSGQMVIEKRTDGSGRAEVFFKMAQSAVAVNKVRAGALSRGGFSLVEFTECSNVEEPLPAQEALRAWLNADSIDVPLGDAIQTWNGQSGNNEHAEQVSGSAASTRPTLVVDGLKAVSFDGSNDRLTFGSEIGQNDFTIVALYKPEAARTVHTPATNYGNRNAGTAGQRYLFAGNAGSTSSSLWPPPQPPQPPARVYSIWEQKYFSDTVFYQYSYDPIPSNVWTASVENRYDNTPLKGSPGRNYRVNNDGDGNGPGQNVPQSNSYWEARFEDHVGGSWFANWSTEHVKVKDNHRNIQNFYGQNITIWEEDYYEYRAKNYQLPYLQNSSQPNPVAIGTVGAGVSIGSNGIGCYEFRNDYNPCKSSTSHTASGWQVASVRYSGKRPKVYAQGVYLGEGAASQAANVNGPQFIGGSPYNSNFFKGKVAEILIFDRALTDGERELVEDYLAERAALTVIDRDSDSLPDWWERRWFGDLDENAAGNPDEDGLTNADELAHGTKPTLRDSDQDGLTDEVEINTTGTNPLLCDTDGDGYPDGYEVTNSGPPLNLDPLDPSDGLRDRDENWIQDGWEFLANYNPATADSDGDGLLDWQEFSIGSDAYKSLDTNGDGISDALAWQSGVNAFNPDHDGDGLTNAEELATGTDMFRSDTDGDGIGDATDAFPLDPVNSGLGTPNPGDTTAPAATVTRPADAVQL